MIQRYTEKETKDGRTCLEVASPEESLYPRLVPTFNHDMVGKSVDNTLGVWYTQLHLERIAQDIDVAVDLLDTGQSHVASAFPQSVDGQFIRRCPGDKVWKVGSDF